MRLSVECDFPELRKRGAVSRKSALWEVGVTEKRILGGGSHGKAHSGCAPHQKTHSGAVRYLAKENRELAADHLNLNVPEADSRG